MAHYLVTGGAGFIGSHLCEALIARGDTPVVLDNLSTGKRENLPSDVPLIVGDIRNPDCLEMALQGVSGIFHLAAIASVPKCHNDWGDSHSVNSLGTVNVLEHATERNLPVVYASSAAVYGTSEKLGVTEEDMPSPKSAYGMDKYSNECQAKLFGAIHNTHTCGLRFFNVFGPRQDPGSPYSGVISIFMDRFTNRSPVTIFGDGGQTRDFIYVGDVVSALLAAFENTSDTAPVFNICTGRSTSLLDLLKSFESLWDFSPEVRFEKARAGDIRHSLGSPVAMESQLHVQANTSLKDGLIEIFKEVTREQLSQKRSELWR